MAVTLDRRYDLEYLNSHGGLKNRHGKWMPERFTERIKNLGEIARMINSGDDLDSILDRVVYAVCRHSDWVMSGILAIDEAAGLSLSVKRFDPYQHDGKFVPTSWDLSTSPVMNVVSSGEPLIIADALNTLEYPAYQEDARLRGYRTTVILPLHAEDDAGRPMILSVQSREPVDVTDRELSFLGMVGNLAAIAVDKAVRIQSERDAAARLRRTVDAYTEVMEPALAGGEIGDVVSGLEHILDVPWLVVDMTTGTVLASRSPIADVVGDDAWREWATGAGRRVLFEIGRDALPHVLPALKEVPVEIFSAHYLIKTEVQSILVDGETVGALLLFNDEPVADDLDQLRMQTVRLALGAALMRNVVKFRSEVTSQTRLISRLFTSDWESRTDLMIRSRAVGVDLECDNHMLFVAVGDRREETDQMRPARLHQLVAGIGGDVFGAQATVELDGMFILLVPHGRAEESRKSSKVKRLEDLVRWASGSDPVIIVSDACSDPSDYGAEKGRCERLIDLANSLDATGLVSARDFGAFPLLLSIAEKPVIQEFLSQTILPIMSATGKRDRALGQTVRAFLETEGRLQACADRLGIHVSTLRYRLTRVSERWGLDLADAKTRFDLQIAFQIYDLTERFTEDRSNSYEA